MPHHTQEEAVTRKLNLIVILVILHPETESSLLREAGEIKVHRKFQIRPADIAAFRIRIREGIALDPVRLFNGPVSVNRIPEAPEQERGYSL